MEGMRSIIPILLNAYYWYYCIAPVLNQINHCLKLMPPIASTTEQSIQSTPVQYKQEQRYIFVLQQYDGTILVGVSTNPSKRIAAINSGMNPSIKKSLTVARIVGVKPVTAERNLITTFKHFETKYGEGSVVAI